MVRRVSGVWVAVLRQTMQFVDLDTAKNASGLRLVVMPGVPSPWSQAAMAILHIKGIEALGVWLASPRRPIIAWTGRASAPVALHNGEDPIDGWAEILALAERIQPTPSLTPTDPEQRAKMLALSDALIGRGGLLWSARLTAIDAGLTTEGREGFPPPVAQYLGGKYGYTEGCADAARHRIAEVLSELEAQLGDGPYYIGDALTALDVYATAAVDAMVLLSETDCPMHPKSRAMFMAMGASASVPASLIAHRDRMHADHIPLPLAL
ncbi:MAG: glutathione S-transferase [Myxococcota bacterium]|jgi:glutathione S-transferase